MERTGTVTHFVGREFQKNKTVIKFGNEKWIIYAYIISYILFNVYVVYL
jgi:hypothetical protein